MKTGSAGFTACVLHRCAEQQFQAVANYAEGGGRVAEAPEREVCHAREHGRPLDERWHVRKDGSRFFCATFTGAPPAVRGDDRADGEPHRMQAGLPSGRRILLVDDDAETLGEVLKSEGAHVSAAGSVADALELARSADFDV